MKRLLSLLLTVCMISGIITISPVYAESFNDTKSVTDNNVDYEKIYVNFAEKQSEIVKDNFFDFCSGLFVADINMDGIPELFTYNESNVGCYLNKAATIVNGEVVVGQPWKQGNMTTNMAMTALPGESEEFSAGIVEANGNYSLLLYSVPPYETTPTGTKLSAYAGEIRCSNGVFSYDMKKDPVKNDYAGYKLLDETIATLGVSYVNGLRGSDVETTAEVLKIYKEKSTTNMSDTIYWNDHTYKIYDTEMTWQEAKKYCENAGGYLATFTSKEEWEAVHSKIKDYYWLGGYESSNGAWNWVTGENWSFADWCPGEPNNGYGGEEGYLGTYTGSYQWNDFKDENLLGFVCEFDNSNTVKEVSVYLNGEKVVFDVPPIIEDGRTMIPVRAVLEKMGLSVSWNPVNEYVVANGQGNSIMMKINDHNILVNDKAIWSDVAPKVIDGRTLIPIRNIIEPIGAKVEWNQDTWTVTIDYVKAVDSDPSFSNVDYEKIYLDYAKEIDNGKKSETGFALISTEKNDGVILVDLNGDSVPEMFAFSSLMKDNEIHRVSLDRAFYIEDNKVIEDTPWREENPEVNAVGYNDNNMNKLPGVGEDGEPFATILRNPVVGNNVFGIYFMDIRSGGNVYRDFITIDYTPGHGISHKVSEYTEEVLGFFEFSDEPIAYELCDNRSCVELVTAALEKYKAN